MRVSTEKIKVKSLGTNEDVAVSTDGEAQEMVTRVKYLGAATTDDARSSQELKNRIAVATSSLAYLVG